MTDVFREIAMSEFSERIKCLRKEKGLTQRDMASKLGMTVSGYGYYEQGRNEPSTDVIVQIADILEVSTDYLLKGKLEPDYREQAKEILDDPNALIAGRDGNIDAETMLKAIEEILKKRNKE